MTTWSAGGDLNHARMNLAGCGTQSAGLSFGGHYNYEGGESAETEEYNGTAWSSGGAISSRSSLAGCGTQAAGLCFGGASYGSSYRPKTEEYNGTAWSDGGDLATGRLSLAGCGTQSAGLCFGGRSLSVTYLASTEEYNGTAWSSGGDLTTGRNTLAGCGTQSAGLSSGGYNGDGYLVVTEEYNGTAWSAGGDLANARAGLAGGGLQTAGLSFGGSNDGVLPATEEYNGTAWSAGGDLSTARGVLAGCGTQDAGLSFGGNDGSAITAATEEYGDPTPTARTSAGAVLFNGLQYVGDYNSGTVFQLSMDAYTDAGLAISRIRRTQIINKERVNVIHNKIEVDFEHGVAQTEGSNPQATLKWSDDEGHTWSEGRLVSIGGYEEYGARTIWRNLGKSRNRIYELAITNPVKVIITGAYATLKACKF